MQQKIVMFFINYNINCNIFKKLLYFAYSVISNHIIIDNYYYLLLLCKNGKALMQ